MKTITKNIAVAALVCLSMFALQSCEKEDDEAVTTNISVQISVNSTYRYALPAINGQEKYTIETGAAHSIVSEIAKDAQGATVYQYTPTANYKGTDHIVISSEEEDDNHGSGRCSGNDEHEEGFRFDIRIEVVDSAAKK